MGTAGYINYKVGTKDSAGGYAGIKGNIKLPSNPNFGNHTSEIIDFYIGLDKLNYPAGDVAIEAGVGRRYGETQWYWFINKTGAGQIGRGPLGNPSQVDLELIVTGLNGTEYDIDFKVDGTVKKSTTLDLTSTEGARCKYVCEVYQDGSTPEPSYSNAEWSGISLRKSNQWWEWHSGVDTEAGQVGDPYLTERLYDANFVYKYFDLSISLPE